MQLGICTVYFRFIPTNLSATLSSVPQSHWLILIAPCLVALTWIRHMKSLAVFSTFANVATMITIVVILLFAGQNLVHRGAFASGLPVATLATAPVFFGSAIYSFEGCGAVPSIHESMVMQNLRSTLHHAVIKKHAIAFQRICICLPPVYTRSKCIVIAYAWCVKVYLFPCFVRHMYGIKFPEGYVNLCVFREKQVTCITQN